MPVLAVGGEKSFGATQAAVMRNVAVNVQEAVVPGSGHWLMEENPALTIAVIQDFLTKIAAYFSNWKTRFQSLFMLITVQPPAFA
jgi:hypothetical protein